MRGTSRHNGGRKTERRTGRNREMLAALLAGGAYAGLLTDARPAQARRDGGEHGHQQHGLRDL